MWRILISFYKYFLFIPQGLDHASSEYVVQLLRELAREGRTIICTLREPSSAAFAMFDDLFLIAGGTLVYSGPVAEVPKWFKKLVPNIAYYLAMKVITFRKGLSGSEARKSCRACHSGGGATGRPS